MPDGRMPRLRLRRMPDRRTLRAAGGVLLAALVCVLAWLAVEQQAAGLDRAANEVLATSSGANDSVTNARLSQVFRQLELLAPLRSGLGVGALLAVVAAATIVAMLVGRTRGIPIARPVPGAGIVLGILGALLVVGGAAAAIVYALHLRRIDDGFTVVDDLTPPIAAGFLATALLVAGSVAIAAAALVPAVRGRRRIVGIAGTAALGLLFAAIAVLSPAVTSSNALTTWLQSSPSRTPATDVAIRVTESVLRTVDDGPAIAAALLLLAALTALLLRPRTRPRG